MSSKKELEKASSNALSNDVLSGGALAAMFEEEGASGFENADANAYAIPFLQILQSMSPQCKKSEGAYIKGAEEGMLFNTVTQEVVDTEKNDFRVVPCYYRRAFVEWAPREAGGGYRGEHAPTDPIVSTTTRGEKGDILPNGNYLVDTRYHYVLIVKPDGSWSPAVISFTSTQVKKSRQWMSRMDGIKFRNASGQMYTPPMYSHSFQVLTQPEKNDKGSWYGWKIGDAARIEDTALFQAAKELKRAIAAGEVKEQPPAPPLNPSEDDIPY